MSFGALGEVSDLSRGSRKAFRNTFIPKPRKLDYCFGFFEHAPVTLFEISVLQRMQSSKIRFVGDSFGRQQNKKQAQKTGNE